MKIPYLGKIKFWWCDCCNIPLIKQSCSRCNNLGRKSQIAPPGDIRPAFTGDIDLITDSLKNQYGDKVSTAFKDLTKSHIILLNKVPYDDRMDEIIIDGYVIGLFRYNLVKEIYEVLPKFNFATWMGKKNPKSTITVDKGAAEKIKKGGSVLVPGVKEFCKNISLDDPVLIIHDDEVIAVGLSKMDSNQMAKLSRGIAVKTKYRLKNNTNIKFLNDIEVSIENAIEGNSESLKKIENEAINFINKHKDQDKKKVVSYSGGKDSLVVLELVNRSEVHYEIIFINTKLEFPETLDNIQKISQYYSKEVIEESPTNWDFWERFINYGPPARDSRWCCKSAKLTPVNTILDKMSDGQSKIISFIGTRKYESLGRSNESRISKNQWTPKQISVSPIFYWNALEVYLYIYWRKISNLLNPLYDIGYFRVGCWPCPASSMSDFVLTKKIHPQLHEKLLSHLELIQESEKKPEKYISWGLWRWKKLPQKIINLLKISGSQNDHIEVNNLSNKHITFKAISTINPCQKGGYSCLIKVNTILDLDKIENYLPILGEVKYFENYDYIQVFHKKESNANVFRDGSIEIRGKDVISVKKFTTDLIKTILRGIHCDTCSLCIHHCKYNALSISENVLNVNRDLCINCLVCNDFCPFVRYQKSLEISLFED